MEKYCQIIILSSDGFILESDNVLFDAKEILNQSAKEIFPLFDSISKEILALSPDDAPLQIPSVNTESPLLPGIYDYRFSRHNSSQILWVIEDCTVDYMKNRDLMQLDNDKTIARERKN